ncbi:MAG: hypothetical protein ACE5K0_06535, partial [Candidatus Methanofastidiosia archaeon]
MISDLNIVIPEENQRVLQLSDEGINLAKKIDKVDLEKYIVILKNEAKLFLLIRMMKEILLGLRIQNLQEERLFSSFYNRELLELNNLRNIIIREMNDALKELLNGNHVYYYIAALSIIIDTVSLQLRQFAIFDKTIIKEEEQGRSSLISQCEYLIENLKEQNLLIILYKSLADYYYCICKTKKAIEYMNKAIEIARKDKDISFVKANTQILEKMKNKPNL